MLSRFLSGLGKTMISFGLLILLFVVFQLWGTGVEESRHQSELEDSLVENAAAVLTPSEVTVPADTQASPSTTEAAAPPENLEQVMTAFGAINPDGTGGLEAPKIGEPIGVLEINPQYNQAGISIRKVIIEGTSKEDLKKGPGHYETTAQPGQPGNAGIAGHRSTYGAPFNKINELRPGDQIFLYTKQGKFTYEVLPAPEDAPGETGEAYWIVKPDNKDVLAPTLDNRLTLTACHPQFSAALRIIVAAKLVGNSAPEYVVSVDAPSQPDQLGPDEETGTNAGTEVEQETQDLSEFGTDFEALPETLMWASAAFGVWLVAFLVGLKLKRRRWIGYLAFAVPFFACVWFTFMWLDRLIPTQ